MDNLHKQLLYPRAIALQIFVMHLLEICFLSTSYHISANIKQPKDGTCRNLKNASQLLNEIQEKKFSYMQTMQ